MKFELFGKDFFRFVEKAVDNQFTMRENPYTYKEHNMFGISCDSQTLTSVNFFCNFSKTESEYQGLTVGYMGQSLMFRIFRNDVLGYVPGPGRRLNIHSSGEERYSIQIHDN